MRVTDSHPEVLIIGAGPSGLMMAAQLLRSGVHPVIIDSRQGPTSHSKALAVQARSVEIYRQMGLASRMLKDSTFAHGLKFHHDGKPTARLDLETAGIGQTPFPHIYLYEQSKTERLLLDYLTQQCCPVYWETTLLSVEQFSGHVVVQLQTNEESYQLNCNWLIGADGARSAVRKQLQIPFTGDTYPHQFFLADIKLSNAQLNHQDLQLYAGRTGFAAFFLMPEQDTYRIVGNVPIHIKDTDQLQLTDVQANLEQVIGFELQVEQCQWFTTYRLHHRMAERFHLNRYFLIGDAAHIHSPVGGQGMNTGLQDAYNLAWKLAGVITGQLKPEVLDTYAAERMPVARELLRTTDRAFNLVSSTNAVASLFKKWALPKILNWAWKKETWRKEFFKRISQTGIQYRDSKLSLHLSQAGSVKAGDRLPYLKLYDEKKRQETDLHAWCSKPGFTLITFGPLQEDELFALAKWITQTYSTSYLNFFHLPYSDKNQQVFDCFEIKPKHVKALLVRPDMHIGLFSDRVDIDVLDNYIQNVAGLLTWYKR